jgi:hypothetical protein
MSVSEVAACGNNMDASISILTPAAVETAAACVLSQEQHAAPAVAGLTRSTAEMVNAVGGGSCSKCEDLAPKSAVEGALAALSVGAERDVM